MAPHRSLCDSLFTGDCEFKFHQQTTMWMNPKTYHVLGLKSPSFIISTTQLDSFIACMCIYIYTYTQLFAMIRWEN